MLTAAALTYVAALSVTIMQFLRLLLIVAGGNRRRRLTMDERTEQGRRFLMGYRDDDTTEFVSDQEKKLPQPPLCKAPMGGERTVCCREIFPRCRRGGGLYDLLTRRRSARIYTEGELSLLQLSFLLWATQGVRAMRGRAYATLRTVPSGGCAPCL